jgi:membrane-associated phospholipid phosphatase
LHYPTDVLGGWSLAAAWVCGLASLREFLSRGAVRRPLLPELAEAP